MPKVDITDKSILRKKLILKISCVILIILLLCTFISHSIFNILLPEVEVVKISNGEIEQVANFNGNVFFPNHKELESDFPMVIDEIFVKEGTPVEVGTKLFSFDTSETELNDMQLELAVKNAQNQLNKATSNDTMIKYQIELAKAEYTLFTMNADIMRDRDTMTHESLVQKYSEDSAIAQLHLQQNILGLNEHMDSITNVDRSTELNLRDSITALQKQLSDPALTPEQIADFNQQITSLNRQLYSTIDNYPKSNTSQEMQIRSSLMMAENNLLLNNNVSEKTSAQLDYDMALKNFENNAVDYEINAANAENKLNQTVATYESQLATSNIDSLQLSLTYAKTELENFRKYTPKDGVVKSDFQGEIIGMNIESGKTTPANTILINYSIESPEASVKWTTSYELGQTFDVDTVVVAEYTLEDRVNAEFTLTEDFISKLSVNTKEYIKEENVWEFTAKLPEEKLPFVVGSTISLTVENPSPTYYQIVPISAVNENPDGTFFIQMVSSKRGIFSEENVIVTQTVEILESNSISAAIDGHIGMDNRVVKYANRPIKNGSIVSVVNEIEE